MQDETMERWKQLCEQAAVDGETQKLLEFIREINHLIEQQQLGLKDEVHAHPNQTLLPANNE